MAAYSNQGDYSVSMRLASEAYEKAPNLPQAVAFLLMQAAGEQIDRSCRAMPVTSRCFQPLALRSWIAQALADYLWHERELYAYWSDLKFTYKHRCVEGYRRLFLEPLG